MPERNVAVRIQAVGGDKVKATFAQIGRTGTSSLQSIERASNSSRFAMQNAAFQVQDFFVQVSSGTSPVRALSQQLPQLLGSFGLFGALAGTAVAALAPLIGKMFEGAEAGKDLTEVFERMEKSVADAGRSTKAARVPLAELTKQYGDLADEIERARTSKAALDQSTGRSDVKAGSRGLAEEILGRGFTGDSFTAFKSIDGDLSGLIEKTDILRDKLAGVVPLSAEETALTKQIEANQALIDTLTDSGSIISEMADKYGLAADEAVRLVSAAIELRDAKSLEEQAAAADELRAFLVEVFGSEQDVESVLPGILDKLISIVQAAGDLGSNMAFSADEAARLSKNISEAIDKGERAQNYLKNAKIIGAYQLYGATRMAAPDDPVVHSVPRSGRRSGGGGGGSSEAQRERNQLTREAERIYDSTRTAVEKYNIEQAKLNELLKAGYIDQDTYNRALEELKERTLDAGMSAKEMKSAFGDAFAGIVTGATSAREALANLLSTFASSLANSAFNSLWSSIFPGGGLGFGGARAMGGPVSPGRWYMVGENGPESFVPSVPGTIVPNNALRGAGGGVVINIDARGAQEGVAEQIRRAMDAAVPRILKASTASVADARLRGKRV